MKSAMTIIKTAAVCCAVLLTVSCESTELRYIDKDERNPNEARSSPIPRVTTSRVISARSR